MSLQILQVLANTFARATNLLDAPAELDTAAAQSYTIELLSEAGIALCCYSWDMPAAEEDQEIVIGRSAKADIGIAFDPRISRFHLAIGIGEDGRFYTRDLWSTNGTFLNGRKLPSGLSTWFAEGDIVSLGKKGISCRLVRRKNRDCWSASLDDHKIKAVNFFSPTQPA